ncbi:MAG: T9SS type A sorting domain-containing protein [Ignavibacteria bacterium]|nr:T9SS type A sorting domain-containing protein [Ignavibacteria bacterium]
MKKIPFLFLLICLLMSVKDIYSQQGWYIQQSTFQYPITDIFFIDAQTGWISSDSGRVYKSTDGGANWTLYNSGTDYRLYSIKFANSMTGWAVGGLWYSNPFNFEYAMIVKTTNGGVNWVTQFTTSSGHHFNSLSVSDENNAFILSYGIDISGYSSTGSCTKTTNGGTNWFSDSISGNVCLSSMSFPDSQNGFIFGYTSNDITTSHRYIYKTTNKGYTWQRPYQDTLFNSFGTPNSKIYFPDVNTGYFYDNVLKKTTNGGVSFVKIDSVNSYGSRNLFFISKDTGWICGGNTGAGFIRRTTNGGLNWTNQFTPDYMDKIFFLNQYTGWGINSQRILIKTVTGGVGPDWDTATARYLPMAVGNKYIYMRYETPQFTNPTYVKSTIIRDSIIEGNKYFLFQNNPLFQNYWIHYDSTTRMVLARTNFGVCGNYASDRIVDSLASKVNDNCNNCAYTGFLTRTCIDTLTSTLFGNFNTKRKNFRHDGLALGEAAYSKYIGVSSSSSSEAGTGTTYTLLGCCVNGITYGDTNMYYTVSGTVRYNDNNQIVTAGIVKAVKLNRVNMNVVTVDSAFVQTDGTYALHHVPMDSLYIGLYPTTTPPRDYMISYYPSTIYWQQATVIYPTGNLTNLDLGATRYTETTTNKSISGIVVSLSGVFVGNLKDANLYAKSGNTFLRCAISDSSGTYHLNSLPSGELKIIVDRLGYRGDSAAATLALNNVFDCVNFYLNPYYLSIDRLGNVVPDKFMLSQNFPNPFNPVTNIKFDLPFNRFVKLTMYNALGQELETPLNKSMNAGSYSITWNASSYPSGVYFYRIYVSDQTGRTADIIQTKKMILIK